MTTRVKKISTSKLSFQQLIDKLITKEQIENIVQTTGIAKHNFTKAFKNPELAKSETIAGISVILRIHPWVLINKYNLGKSRLSKMQIEVWKLSHKQELATTL